MPSKIILEEKYNKELCRGRLFRVHVNSVFCPIKNRYEFLYWTLNTPLTVHSTAKFKSGDLVAIKELSENSIEVYPVDSFDKDTEIYDLVFTSPNIPLFIERKYNFETSYGSFIVAVYNVLTNLFSSNIIVLALSNSINVFEVTGKDSYSGPEIKFSIEVSR